MPKPLLHIELLSKNYKIPYDLLLMADPSKTRVQMYLKSSSCFLAILESEVVGVLVLDEVNPKTAEIKNIAVRESEQGKGFGKQLLRFAEQLSRRRGYKKLIIGTGNSSLRQLALYQKEGFELDRVEKNFFLENYDKPIVENGIPCKHLLILEKKLHTT